MKTAIAYILTILGLPVAAATVIPLILAIPFTPTLKKSDSKIPCFIFNFVTETIAGIIMIWLTIILWTWLKVTPSILTPILLVIPIIIWNWERMRKYIGANSFWDELASGLGELSGVIVGAIFFL